MINLLLLPKDMTELAGLLVYVSGFVIAFLKAAEWSLDKLYKTRIQQSADRVKEKQIDLELAKVDLEKVKNNQLSALHVGEILSHYMTLRKEIDEMKASDKVKDEAFSNALDKLEELLEEMRREFIDYLKDMAAQKK